MPEEKPITSSDLRTALDAAVQAITARQDSALQAMTARQDSALQAMTGRQDSAVETIAGEISSLREEMMARFTDVDRRQERTIEAVRSLQVGVAALNNGADRLDKDQAALGQNYFAHQRAIEELKRRVEALEKKAS